MPWFKVDDNLAFHQKAVRAGNAAMGLWVRAGSWSAQQLSDGYVPRSVARTLGTAAEARRLVDAHLWLEGDDGYDFWQWNEEGRQPTRVEVEEKRKATRERQRRAREKAQAVTASVTRDTTRDSRSDDTRTDAVSHTSPDPTRPDPTRPDPTHKDTTPSESTPLKRGTRIPKDWKPNPADIAWQTDHGISDFLARREHDKFLDYWNAKSGREAVKVDWSATWRNWLRNTLEREPQRGTSRPSTPWAGS